MWTKDIAGFNIKMSAKEENKVTNLNDFILQTNEIM